MVKGTSRPQGGDKGSEQGFAAAAEERHDGADAAGAEGVAVPMERKRSVEARLSRGT